MAKKLLYHPQFQKESAKLPTRLQGKLEKRLELLREDIFHPALDTKSLQGDLSDAFSFRITREYRVIFRMTESNNVFLLRVGHRKDIYDT
jgi:addiction module RelE/StbE family toxin